METRRETATVHLEQAGLTDVVEFWGPMAANWQKSLKDPSISGSSTVATSTIIPVSGVKEQLTDGAVVVAGYVGIGGLLRGRMHVTRYGGRDQWILRVRRLTPQSFY